MLLLVIVLASTVLWMAGGMRAPGPRAVVPRTVGEPPPVGAAPATLTVVTWNIAWAYGWGSEGTGTRKKSQAEIEDSLQAMGRWLRAVGADVVLLQEVDTGARRSHGIDQGEVLSRAAGLAYYAPAESWSVNYLPFPYWPPSRHFGRLRSGGAVLSRFPITEASVELLSKPAAQPRIYRLFYLFRYVIRCRIALGGGESVRVYNVHLETPDGAARALQAARVADILRADTGGAVIFGGDVNSPPPEARVRAGYPDEPATDHRDDAAAALFRSLPGLVDTVSPEAYLRDEPAWFTFPSHAPNRKLDYLFASADLTVDEVRVGREAGTSSDHLPLVARLRLR